eukprot:scaffold5560_cov444-Prasinococcus_capsulatus_cf.AAC.6
MFQETSWSLTRRVVQFERGRATGVGEGEVGKAVRCRSTSARAAGGRPARAWEHAHNSVHFLGQASFPLTKAQYYEQTDAVAEVVSTWGLADHVRKEIKETTRQPGISKGGSTALAVSIFLTEKGPGLPGADLF